MKLVLSPLFQIGLCTLGYLYITSDVIQAQVTADDTLNTNVNQNGKVAEITGGSTRGDNLFHSFREFSITSGNEAFFDNATDIANIFSRVTGGKVSNIDGLIRANGNASLFLINPQGIIFGEGASLDIGGSFYGSSASGILFEDGEFSATDLDNPPLLTVNAPVGLSFRDNPGDIVNRSTDNNLGLAVIEGNNISLLGGDINLEGGKVTAPGGIVELGGLSTSGIVDISEDGSLNFPEGVTRGDVSLTKQAAVNVRADGGGFININAQNLSLSERSELFAGIAEGRGSEDAVAGDINIDATESVKIVGEEDTPRGETTEEIIENSTIARSTGVGIRNNVGLSSVKRNPVTNRSSAIGTGGDINITTGTLELLNVSSIDTNLYGTGEGGDINITAKDISLTGFLSVFVAQVGGFNFDVVKEQGRGDGGNVNINTGSITFNDQAGIFADVQSGAIGNGGDIIINATDKVAFTGGEASHLVLTQLGNDAVGNGGDIKITADTLNLTNAQLIADLLSGSKGKGGNIELNIAGDISIDEGSQILVQVQDGGMGDSGDIAIDSNNLTVNNSSILADTKGEGNAGNITFNASDSILINNGSQILVQVQDGAMGNSGDILIDSNNLEVSSSSILADTKGKGNAGNITFNASDSILINEGSQILAQVQDGGMGDSGDIAIDSNNLEINDSSSILADTKGKGNAGNIAINASDSILINEGSQILAQVQESAIGDSGDIIIDSNNLEINDSSSILADTKGEGNAGNINLNVTGNIDFTNSIMLSKVEENAEGNAGDISVRANSLNLENGSLWITNTAGKGNAGKITIDVANQFTLNQGSLILSQVLTGGRGDAGDINITTGSLKLTNSLIIADSGDLGNGGNINIFAEDTIVMQGFPQVKADKLLDQAEVFPSAIITGLDEKLNAETMEVESAGKGNAGNIDITASQLILKDLASVISNVEKTTIGAGGEINLNLDLLRLENNSFVSTFTESEFKAGSINVNSQNLELVSGGKLITSTDGIGSAGTINLNITDNISIDNAISPTVPRVIFNEDVVTELQGRSGLFANATERATGNGGNIFIGQDLNSPITDITIANGGEVRADGGVDGDAGNIFISANSLSLDGDAVIVAETISDQGANINLQLTENITLDNNSSISARAFKAGNGGNLTIDTNFVIATPNGNNDIIANAERGNGGNIKINAESLFGIKERPLNDLTNDINASSEFGLDGTVSISTLVDRIKTITELPSNVIEPQETTTQACDAQRGVAAASVLTVKGRGGMPPEPIAPLNSENILINEQAVATSPNTQPQAIPTAQGDIIPARGIVKTNDGRIILSAYPTDNQGNRLPQGSGNCS